MSSSCRTSEPRALGALAIACVLAVFCGLASARVIFEGSTPDQTAAFVVFPLVRVDTASGLDTVLRLSNASSLPADLRCFYEDTTAHCSNSSDTCENDSDCPVGGICQPAWQISDFSIRLTAQQPVEWRASQGLDPLPAPGNQGSIPPLSEDPFIGALRCVVVDALTGFPPTPGGSADVLEGVATIEREGAQAITLSRYRAIGFVGGDNDGDGNLVLGLVDSGGEYESCPGVVILSHLFENAAEPVRGDTTVTTQLALVPCRADYVTQVPVSDVVHLNVYNEFEQRIGVSARLGPQLFAPLSRIHPTLFDIGVQGTVAGQTRIFGAGGGVVGVAIEELRDGAVTVAAPARVLYHLGSRFPADVVVIPAVP